MAMPKAPISITLDPCLPITVSGIDGEGREFTSRPLTSIPATWLRRVAASLNVAAGKGTSNEAMIDGIVAVFDPNGKHQPINQPTTNQSTTTTKEKAPVPTTTTTNQPDDLRSILQSAIGIDEARVIELIAEHAPEGTSRTITVQRRDVPAVTIDGAHPLFEEVLTMLVDREESGRYPFLVGPAGSGKSYLAGQLATALGLPLYTQSFAPTPQEHLFTGFMNAMGEYVESAWYRWAKHGGVFLGDEKDRAWASTLVLLNDALASRRFTFPNGELVDFHPDAHWISAGNTLGLGADSQYVTAQVLDQSTLDRFDVVNIDYDTDVERAMVLGTGVDAATADRILARIDRLRTKVAEQSLNLLVSPRASKSIAAAIARGTDWDRAWHRSFFAKMDADTRTKLLAV